MPSSMQPSAAQAANAPGQTSPSSQLEKNKNAAEEAAKTDIAPEGKEGDIIRMEVKEHLPNGLVRIVGEKRVIHRGRPKVVEVTALVNNKDIDDQNHLNSSAFVDFQTQVVQQ